MLVTLTYVSSITVDLEANVTWRAAAARQFGDAQVTVRTTSPAFSDLYIAKNGGSMVEINDIAGGRWFGIIDKTTRIDDTLLLDCIHAAGLVRYMLVGSGVKFQYATAGEIVETACRKALAELPKEFLKVGSFTYSAPIITEYSFNNQDLSTVLSDMMERTGQEWEVTEDGYLNWRCPVGRVIEKHLVDGSTAVGTSRPNEIAIAPSEIIIRDPDGREYPAKVSSPQGLWQSQQLLSNSQTSPVSSVIMGRESLTRNLNTAVLWKTEINRSLAVLDDGSSDGIAALGWGDSAWGDDPWGGSTIIVATSTLGTIRDGDIITIHLPHNGITGTTKLFRVLGRTVFDMSSFILLDMLEMPLLIIGDNVLPQAYLNQSGGAPQPVRDIIRESLKAGRNLNTILSSLQQQPSVSGLALQTPVNSYNTNNVVSTSKPSTSNKIPNTSPTEQLVTTTPAAATAQSLATTTTTTATESSSSLSSGSLYQADPSDTHTAGENPTGS